MNAVLAEKCTQCLTCVADCPISLVTVNSDGFPEVESGKESYCTHCGHCEAVCPQMAADPSLRGPEITPEMLGTYMKKRRSIRNYKSEPVDKMILHEIMDIVRYAPSGHNVQALNWVIIYNTPEVRRLTDMVIEWMCQMVQINHPIAAALNCPQLIQAYETGQDVICRNAPHLIVAYGPKENSSAPTDATIALAHLELAAPAFGLGACWAGFFQIAASFSPELKQALGIPEPFGALGILMIGRPKFKYYQIPTRNEARVVWR